MQCARSAVRATKACARGMSTSADALSPLRTWGTVGKYLRDMPNTVPESQKLFAHKSGFTHLARESDNTWINATYVLTGLVGVYAVGGVYNAITNTNKKA